jgi:hypothetical protein
MVSGVIIIVQVCTFIYNFSLKMYTISVKRVAGDGNYTSHVMHTDSLSLLNCVFICVSYYFVLQYLLQMQKQHYIVLSTITKSDEFQWALTSLFYYFVTMQ